MFFVTDCYSSDTVNDIYFLKLNFFLEKKGKKVSLTEIKAINISKSKYFLLVVLNYIPNQAHISILARVNKPDPP